MTISMNTIPSNALVPLFYAEMDNSAANTAQDSGASLLLGYANTGAAITPNSLVLMPSADYARQICGPGSQLARMVQAYRKTDPFGELYVIAVPEPTGTQATVTLTVTGAATETGTISLYIGNSRVQAAVTNGDDVAAVASSIKDAVAADVTLPFTATAAAGVVTLTARHKGLCGNEIPVTVNYYGFGSGEVLPAGVQIAISAGTKGSGAPVLTGAIAAMADEPFDYIGHPFNDTASLTTLATEMNDTSGRWSYARQLYGHVYTAKIGTLSDLVSAGDQLNQQHITLAGYESDMQAPADELAASRTARDAVFIRNDPARPTQTGELIGMLPAPKGKRFITTEQQSLLSHGVATAYVEGGVLRIQRDVTTYKKNAYGVKDNSYLDSETLHTSAYVLRRLKSVITSKYGRHKVANDGTRFGPGQAIVTPAVIKGELLTIYRQLERSGIVENYDLFKKYLIVERDANDPNRINTLFPPDYVNQLRVFAVVNQFRTQYTEETA
ncbi:phage tail sheath subtilisin-like domain-containing protein [Edwardsiella anguillarum]|uniref:phage tail sheath subtilisin-like domain-containing protein n=2 Tax=Edwardsiella anguillarum TaxID=1821960 RepID=UPI0002DB3C2E|nr:phage tail sheath subtilisin-like domain-containing protein [Edwardsiella anguillarum]KAB0585658.1 phage tail protein [Edwardsiella anguillarum]UOU80308.1 phage tail sheath subtilisin-like domain-containing protein [Edwardsiella anguillarum]